MLPRWSHAAQLYIKISRTAVRSARSVAGPPGGRRPASRPELRSHDPGRTELARLLWHFVEELDRPGGLLETSTTYRGNVEKLLIAAAVRIPRRGMSLPTEWVVYTPRVLVGTARPG